MPRKAVEEKPRTNVKPLLKQIAKEKDLDAEVIKSAIESAILSAAQKRANAYLDPRPVLDVETGDMTLFVKKEVVISVEDARRQIDILTAKARDPKHRLGDLIEVEIDPEEFGRIAAQSVRQGILQRLRDAERDRIYEEYKDKVGTVVTGIVQRYERRDCIVALGRTECLLPHQEIPNGIPRYRFGDRLRCLIIDVRRTPKGPQVILSRTRSELVKQLFALEVPEIHQGVVRIVEIARDPGTRTKIAVNSTDPNVDPVGACVGMKGSRVQMIVRELDNEKVDIVPYSPIPEHFIGSALNPARILSCKLNEVEKRATVVVDNESLSKAIGKRGQNAKLAAKLTGWKIDIVEQEDQEEVARQEEISRQYLSDFLSQIEGLSEFAREALLRSPDLNTVEKLAGVQASQLAPFVNDNTEFAQDIINGAQEYLEELGEMTRTSEAEMDDEMRERLVRVQELADRLAGRISRPNALAETTSEAAPEASAQEAPAETASEEAPAMSLPNTAGDPEAAGENPVAGDAPFDSPPSAADPHYHPGSPTPEGPTGEPSAELDKPESPEAPKPEGT